jgi:type II secretory pathway component PulJ
MRTASFNRSRTNTRHGFTLMETMAGFAFLTISTGFAVQMHQSGRTFDRVSTDRLERQLAIENEAQRLSLIAYEDLTGVVEQRDPHSKIQIQIEPFETESRNGLHVTIRTTVQSQPLQHHVWRMEPSE